VKPSTSTVFRSGNSLAVRLVGECRLPRGTKVREYRVGSKIVIEPVRAGWSARFLSSLGSFHGQIPRPKDPGKQRDPFEQ
jgi:virulence-associated protein VagC